MTRSTKAALLSGLVFPGIGHIVLKRYLRGSVLMASTLIALSVIVTSAVRQALAVVDKVNSGELTLDTGAIAELVATSSSGAEGSIINIAMLVIAVCWVIGIVDSYRIGKAQET
jgi:hypothetical protein